MSLLRAHKRTIFLADFFFLIAFEGTVRLRAMNALLFVVAHLAYVAGLSTFETLH